MMKLTLFILLTIILMVNAANLVTERDVSNECFMVSLYMENGANVICKNANIQNKYLYYVDNITVYYKGTRSNEISIYVESNRPYIWLIDYVGNPDNSPLLDGYYTFTRDANVSIQDAACSLTKNDTIPSGVYGISGMSTSEGYLNCNKDANLVWTSFDILDGININMNIINQPYNIPCNYWNIIAGAQALSYHPNTAIGNVTICGILGDSVDDFTTTTTVPHYVTTTTTKSDHSTDYITKNIIFAIFAVLFVILVCIIYYCAYSTNLPVNNSKNDTDTCKLLDKDVMGNYMSIKEVVDDNSNIDIYVNADRDAIDGK